MKIVEVKTYPVVYPVKEPFSNGMRTTRQRPFGIVEIITDSGLSGWGEGSGVPAQRALESQVIGRSPFDYEVIWQGLQRHKALIEPCLSKFSCQSRTIAMIGRVGKTQWRSRRCNRELWRMLISRSWRIVGLIICSPMPAPISRR